MRCDKCGSDKIVPYMPMTGFECKKCGDKDCNKADKGRAVLSNSTDGLCAKPTDWNEITKVVKDIKATTFKYDGFKTVQAQADLLENLYQLVGI